MLDWLKNIGKDTPEFWKSYLSKFEIKTERYVVISCETNGKNIQKEKIVSVAAIGVVNNSVAIKDSFEIKIDYDLDDVKVQKKSTQTELNPFEALKAFIEYLENAKLISYRIDFEVDIINEALLKLHCGKLKNEVFDLEVMHKKLTDSNEAKFLLHELFSIYNIEKLDRNSPAATCFSMALLFLRLKNRLKL